MPQSSALPAADSVLATAPRDTLIALKEEAIYAATDYWIEGGQLFCVLRRAVNAHSISTKWTGKKLHGSTPSPESPSISGVAHAFSKELPAAGRIEIRPVGFLRRPEAHNSFPGVVAGALDKGKQLRKRSSLIFN